MLNIKSILVILILLISTSLAQSIKGTFAIKNIETEMLLRPKSANKSDHTPIVLYSPTNWKCLTWDFINVNENTYHLKNLFTDKTFQPINLNTSAKIELEQLPLEIGSVKQQWEFIEVNENQYLIKLTGSDLYITPENSCGDTNSNVYLEPKRDDNLQLWAIYEQNPSH
jgi:hypothetical protein